MKPVIGSRGSGKTTCLYYLVHKLKSKKGILPCYVNMREALPYVKESPFPLLLSRNFVYKEIASQTILRATEEIPNLFDQHVLVRSIWEKATGWAPTPRTIPKLDSNDIRMLLNTIHRYDYRVVLAVDELDKMTEPNDLSLLNEFFRSEQTFFTQLASNLRTYVYISSSTMWSFLRSSELTYLGKTLRVNPIKTQEAKNVLQLRFEITNPGVKPPFTDSAIASIVSAFKGNTREIILRSGELLKTAHDRKLDHVDADLVNEVFGAKKLETMKEGYEEIMRTDELAASGAVSLWMVCSEEKGKSPATLRSYLNCMVNIYKNEPVRCSSIILGKLESAGCICFEPRNKPKLHEEIRALLSAWENQGQFVEDFSDWYSTRCPEPPGVPQLYRLLRDILKKVIDGRALMSLEGSWSHYRQLDKVSDPVSIVGISWAMLEQMMEAFVNSNLSDSTRIRRLTGSLIDKFSIALRRANVRFQALNAIALVFTMAQTARKFDFTQACVIKDVARLAFSDLMKAWREQLYS